MGAEMRFLAGAFRRAEPNAEQDLKALRKRTVDRLQVGGGLEQLELSADGLLQEADPGGQFEAISHGVDFDAGETLLFDERDEGGLFKEEEGAAVRQLGAAPDPVAAVG